MNAHFWNLHGVQIPDRFELNLKRDSDIGYFRKPYFSVVANSSLYLLFTFRIRIRCCAWKRFGLRAIKSLRSNCIRRIHGWWQPMIQIESRFGTGSTARYTTLVQFTVSVRCFRFSLLRFNGNLVLGGVWVESWRSGWTAFGRRQVGEARRGRNRFNSPQNCNNEYIDSLRNRCYNVDLVHLLLLEVLEA